MVVYISRVFLTFSLFIGCLSTAHAGLADFEYAPFADGSVQEQVIYDLGDGLTLTMTAFILTENSGGTITSRTQLGDVNDVNNNDGVYLGTSGLGVKIPTYQNNGSDDDSDIDGASGDGQNGTDYDEGILFTFNKTVELVRLNFGSFSGSDDFNLEVDGVNLMHDIGSFDTHSFIKDTPEDDHFYFQNIFGKAFLVWADGDSDDFRIDDITVAVPEPATIPMMVLAISGLVCLRRKRL